MARSGEPRCSRYEKPTSIRRLMPTSMTAQTRLSTTIPARIAGENRQSWELRPASPAGSRPVRAGRTRMRQAGRRQRLRIQASAPVRSAPDAPDRQQEDGRFVARSPAGPRRGATETAGASATQYEVGRCSWSQSSGTGCRRRGSRRRLGRSRAEALGSTRGIMRRHHLSSSHVSRRSVRRGTGDFIIVIVFVAAEKYEIGRCLVAPHGKATMTIKSGPPNRLTGMGFAYRMATLSARVVRPALLGAIPWVVGVLDRAVGIMLASRRCPIVSFTELAEGRWIAVSPDCSRCWEDRRVESRFVSH